MKLKSVQKVMGGILGAVVLLGIPSCSDDHFDIKTQGAGNTIWQNIEANPELKDVAEILKEVKVYTKLEDKKRSMTYAELLNQPQSFTFFAPVDGSFDKNYYLSKIEEIKTKRANGETASADTLEYNLGVQFAQNHLARFNFESVKGEQSLRLYNGKLATFNATEGLFNGVKLNADLTNIASSMVCFTVWMAFHLLLIMCMSTWVLLSTSMAIRSSIAMYITSSMILLSIRRFSTKG